MVPRPDLGLTLLLGGVAAVSSAAYLWMNGFAREATSLGLIGLAGLLASGPFLFGWSMRVPVAERATPCRGCGRVETSAALLTPFCLACGKQRQGNGTQYY